jgi:hypothetical protein
MDVAATETRYSRTDRSTSHAAALHRRSPRRFVPLFPVIEMSRSHSVKSPAVCSTRRLACCLSLAAALCAGSVATAQQTNNGQEQGGTGGGGLFGGAEVDMSAFEGIQRDESSIGTSTRQGFGVESDASPGQATGAPGGGVAAGGLGGFGGGLGGLGGLFGAFGGNMGNQQGTAEKPVLRTRLRSAVEVEPLPDSLVQRSANQVLRRAPTQSGVRGVNVTMQGRTAILTGTVSSEKDRRMSELMIRLEPGVSRIENRVEVAGN